MKEINYKNLIDNKLSKQTKEDNGTAYVAVDGQYEEQPGYGYTQDKWVTLYEGIPSLVEDEDGEPFLWSNTNIFFPENVSPDSVNKIRLIISGENNHDVTSVITYTDGYTIFFGNPYFLTLDTEKDNGFPYSVFFQNTDIHISAYDTFISNGDHVTIMGCIPSVKQIDSSLLPANVFVKGGGEYSIQAKNDTSIIATGEYAVAQGVDTQATGISSHAEGNYTKAIGNYSRAEGSNTIADGGVSHAEGSYTRSQGGTSHAEGGYTITYGSASHAEGYYTVAYGNYSHAEGGYNSSPRIYLTGSGTTYTSSSALYDYYLGKIIQSFGTKAIITSIDITNKTITVSSSLGNLNSNSCYVYNSSSAYGANSHAEGCGTLAKNSFSHAEGFTTIASGFYSHSEGSYTVAAGNNSHAEGGYTKASGQYQHAAGKYNVEDLNNTYAEIIGIGTAESARKNGRTLDWSGNEKLAGSLTLGLGTTDETTITAAQLKNITNPTFITSTTSNNVETLNKTYNEITAALSTGNFIPVCSGMYVTYITGHGFSPANNKRYILTADGKWWYCDGGGQYPSYSSSAT